MIKTKTVIEHKIGERTYEFYCTADSPLGEIHDALCVFKSFIIDQIKQAEEKEKPKE